MSGCLLIFNAMQIVYASDQIRKFIDSLESIAQTKVFRSFDSIETYGRSVGLPLVRRLERELSELRIHGRQEVRLFFAFRDTNAVILHAFVKKSMRIPWYELDTARKRLATFDKR